MILISTLLGAALAGAATPAIPDIGLFFRAASLKEEEARPALETLAAAWKDGYAGPLIDLARFMRPPRGPESGGSEEQELPRIDGDEQASPFRRPAEEAPRARPDPSTFVRQRLTRFLAKQTRQRHGNDLRAWRRWLWSVPYDPHPDYARFKAALYANVDPRMASFFPAGVRSLVRLDEVDWGGVRVNGIPPLDHPPRVSAAEARWLKDKDVVFGIALGGEARAYPKRILGWHELARDRLGGVELTIVYCTLCGTVVPYASEAGGRRHTFGTSGLLYRSNKLLFDEETMSLWSTLEGRPVIGALAGSGLELTAYPVVTTTWREWRSAHPETTVLSLATGFERDYSEGAAYREYFATDALMFEVPRTDPRLKNKDEVLALLVRPAGAEGDDKAARQALAVSVRFLSEHPVHQMSFAGRELAFVTSPDGANRVYDGAGARFTRLRPDGLVEDAAGGRWRVAEDALVHEHTGERRARVPARRAFWFGWQAQFPDTVLVK